MSQYGCYDCFVIYDRIALLLLIYKIMGRFHMQTVIKIFSNISNIKINIKQEILIFLLIMCDIIFKKEINVKKRTVTNVVKE